MYTDIRIQELYIPHTERQRAKDAVKHDMIRLATASRPGMASRIFATIGAMLISTGEFLRQQPANLERERTIRTGTPAHRGLEQRPELSHSKT